MIESLYKKRRAQRVPREKPSKFGLNRYQFNSITIQNVGLTCEIPLEPFGQKIIASSELMLKFLVCSNQECEYCIPLADVE
jgi:hypothetical protein